MDLNDVLRNRQTKSQSAKLSGDGWISLLEWLEQGLDFFLFNSDPIISDFKFKPATVIVRCANIEGPAPGGEFHRVVDQIPKHLLHSDRIGPKVMFLRIELG